MSHNLTQPEEIEHVLRSLTERDTTESAGESAVKAGFYDGMISVTLPKSDKARNKPREIEITVS